MPKLIDEVRETRRARFAGKWVPSREFTIKRPGVCTACGEVMPEGSRGVFCRWLSLGQDSRLTHPGCVDRLPPKDAE